MTDIEDSARILVWFEDNTDGHTALLHAQDLANREDAKLTVVTVAVHERLVGCGRCLQGTALWNIEMQKIAREELAAARNLLGEASGVDFESVVGSPADAITETAERVGAQTIVLPRQRNRRFGPPGRRDIDQRVALRGNWRVITTSQPVVAQRSGAGTLDRV